MTWRAQVLWRWSSPRKRFNRGSELPLADGLRLEGDLNHQLAATEDRAEGLAAFFNKRPPDFAGR